ncbi:DUF1156 domain-containing protein, partial [Planctomycetota bacterium]
MEIYPKRLIEVDLPIKQISEYARNEKNLRKGHPWHLHIWWARRPWGACRAVELASLLPAPTDENCPNDFIEKAHKILSSVTPPKEKTRQGIQDALLRFIAEFSSWEMGMHSVYLETAIKLIKLSFPDNRPLVLDSFSGYGAIPGEAARLGCESIAGELNPVALLCLTSLLEVTTRHGHHLLESVRNGAKFIKEKAQEKLSEYYPAHDGKYPIAWLWARTVTCEGPGCGAKIPLVSQTILAKSKRKAWIEIEGDSDTKEVRINIKQGNSVPKNLIKTAGGGHAVCPVCGFTTNKKQVKLQGKSHKMGHRLFGKALAIGSRQGKQYRNIDENDLAAYDHAKNTWKTITENDSDAEITESFPLTYGLHVPPHYGISSWGDLFSPRQKLALHTIGEILHEYGEVLKKQGKSEELTKGVITILSLAVSNSIHYQTTMSTWLEQHMISCFITGNAIAMRWDWAEANPLVSEYVGGLDYSLNQAMSALDSCVSLNTGSATVMKADATALPLPDDSTDIFFTDPPYYDVVPYADLSDLCYVWLKRYTGKLYPEFFTDDLTPKKEQIVVNPYTVKDGRGDQSPENYQERMTAAFSEGRRVLKTDGIGTIVFAHKGTAAWETLLASILDAGFIVTASWPIDTERAARMRAHKSAALGSSIHIIIRPRVNPDGSLRMDDIGDWRDVLAELPKRIHEWMPRLAEEGVVGADAIFACLGPALEIYSRYSSVEKASGEKVELKEYLEEIWAAVSREALNMIFEGADASGFEEDARLTAMWLWTLRTAVNGVKVDAGDDSDKTKSLPGYSLEYDAARKIAQGLGAHLENLSNLVEIKGNTAMLLSAAARTRYLFGKDAAEAPKGKRKKKSQQLMLDFAGELEEIEQESGDWKGELSGKAGSTVLDQLHQSMILFAAGRGE